MENNKTLEISEQINTQYRLYALYVLQARGIPNFYDGLTPVQRLILEKAPVKSDKTMSLIGDVYKTGRYHHGDLSLTGAIAKLARTFGISYPILEGKGFFGTNVSPKPAAPRYTEIKINNKIKDIIFKNWDLNTKNEEDGYDWINVEFPIGLVSHIIGIAVGYRSNILPRKFEDIVEYLDGNNKQLKPYFKDFSGKISKYKNEENVWLLESVLNIDEKKKIIHIYDLPPVIRYDGFITKLYNKLDTNNIDYKIENHSKDKCDLKINIRNTDEDNFKIMVEMISRLTKILVKEDIIFIKDGGVLEFKSVKEYLDHFKGHLEYIRFKRLMKDIEIYSDELEFLEAKLKFLNFMIVKKRKNDEIIEFLSQFKIHISQRLQKIEIIKLNIEHIKETENKIKELKKNISETKNKAKQQEKIYKKTLKEIEKLRKIKSYISIENNLIETNVIDGIEMFCVDEEEEKIDESIEIDEI